MTLEEQYVGKNYGRLTVLKLEIKKHRTMAICRCECGNVVSVRPTRLDSRVYGCKKCNVGANHPSYSGYKDITGHYWCSVENRANRKQQEFKITKKYMWELFEQQNRRCALSNIELICGKKGVQTASIDRIDSNLGYIEGNVQWVHKYINSMKNALDEEEFIQLCNMVSKTHPRTSNV